MGKCKVMLLTDYKVRPSFYKLYAAQYIASPISDEEMKPSLCLTYGQDGNISPQNTKKSC